MYQNGTVRATADNVGIKEPVTYTVCSTTSKGQNACDFVGNGTADDVAINAAITACPVNGCEIELLEGTYNITSSIVPKNGVDIEGAGASTTILMGQSGLANTAVIYAAPNTIHHHRHLTILPLVI